MEFETCVDMFSYNALVFGLRMTLTALVSDSFGP